MSSFWLARKSVQEIDIAVLVTTGLSNTRRTGDRADYQKMVSKNKENGTIDIIAMLEALLMVTEAKTAALQDAGIFSPVSHRLATRFGRCYQRTGT